jgi:flagellar hook-basal body complex protein FliE
MSEINLAPAISAYMQAQKHLQNTSSKINVDSNFQKVLQKHLDNNISPTKMNQIASIMQVKQNQAMMQDIYQQFQGGGEVSKFASSVINDVRQKITRQEEASRDLVTGKGSALELLVASSEASQSVSALSKVYEEVVKAYDKVMSLNI